MIDLTKQNSLLEVNLVRMTRKYQALEEQEGLLRRNYKNVELEMSEMEVSCMKRINQLKEWKRMSTFQLKQLYEQLRVAIPLAEYESVSKDLEIYKQKCGDYIVRNKDYAKEIDRLRTDLRNIKDDIDAQRDLAGDKADLEREYHSIRIRLEALDPKFRWENQIYHKMVQILKKSKISVTQAFEYFDENSDGHLSRQEFVSALSKMGLDLSNSEIDLVLRSLDSDGDGNV